MRPVPRPETARPGAGERPAAGVDTHYPGCAFLQPLSPHQLQGLR